MILKELKAALSDLGDARDSVEQGKYKWATNQGPKILSGLSC